TLTSSAPLIASVPPSFTIPVGNNSQSFTIQGLSPGSATITASLAGTPSITRTAQVTVTKNQLKENKDNKDIPDRKDAKDAKDGGKGNQLIKEKVALQPQFSVSNPARPAIQILAPATAIGAAQLSSNGEPPAATAQAFIRPEERPSVGT